MSEQQTVQFIAQLIQQSIDQHDFDVPMLPEVANKALLLSQDPEASAAEMASLIQSDPALAAHVMRIANSVAYTPLANLVSLQQAIARLGMMTISEIALAASIGAKLFDVPSYEQHIAKVWRHAVASGLWAKEIARQIRSNVEVAFLAGLLHSIDRPAVLQMIVDLSKQHDMALTDDVIVQLETDFQHQLSERLSRRGKCQHLSSLQ
jgi:HD-like signal output (HDOD) protein